MQQEIAGAADAVEAGGVEEIGPGWRVGDCVHECVRVVQRLSCEAGVLAGGQRPGA